MARRIASAIREQTRKNEQSRRRFLSRSTLAGGALLALGSGAGMALAQDDQGDDGTEITATFDDVEGTDADVLNYALSLERLESAFYDEVVQEFSENDFADSDALQDLSEEDQRAAYGYLETIGEHEANHVDVLTQAADLLGGDLSADGDTDNETTADENTTSNDTTTDEDTNGNETTAGDDTTTQEDYDFGIESVEDVISTGAELENVGVAAYAGAAVPYRNVVADAGYAAAAEAIHEARRAFVKGEQKHKALVILTDGEDHEEGVEEAIEKATSEGIVVYTIGVGTTKGSPIPDMVGGYQRGFKKDDEGNIILSKLNEGMLTTIAMLGNGKYYQLSGTGNPLPALLRHMNNLDKKGIEEVSLDNYVTYYQFPLAIGFFLLLIELLLSARKPKWWHKLNLFET
jgi:hypothetical protein